ncbi:MAG TPA: SOS response-associated peptidase [Solirubrobacteraceae bacterium]
MCGRYTLTLSPADLEMRFGTTMPQAARGGRYNVAPTEDILTVARSRETGQREGRVDAWGLWGKPVINVRSESVLEKAGFRRLAELPSCRCLIAADGFYEWLKSEDKRRPREPFRFTVDEGAPFAFAGLCSRGTAAILTCAPNPLVARLHDRMPVILAGPEAEEAWLHPEVSVEEALSYCVPLDAARMASAPVSRRVNKAGPDVEGPDLLVPDAAEEPVPDAQTQLFA